VNDWQDGRGARKTLCGETEHIVPTAVAHHGNSYVGNLHTFPIQEGSSKILKIKPSGQVEIVVTGVTRTQDLYRAKEP